MSFLSGLLPAIGGIGGGALGFALGGLPGAALGASLGGSLGGGLAAGQAANAQTNYGNQALDLQRRQYQQTQQNLAPYLAAGTGALPTLQNLAGVGTGTPDMALLQDPSYQWRLQQGEDAIMNKRAAMGGALSGGTLKDLTNYAQGAASQEYGNIFNRVAGLTGMGQNAAVGLGGFGANYANQGSNLLSQIGNVQGAGIMGGANAATGGINNWLLANALQQGGGLGSIGNLFGPPGANLPEPGVDWSITDPYAQLGFGT